MSKENNKGSYLFQLDCQYRLLNEFLSKKTVYVLSTTSSLLKRAHFL
jgi:hypothetical protein